MSDNLEGLAADEQPNPGDASKRLNDPDATKADILAVATHEFAEKGFSGARIDEIAERTNASKRMIYYYYGGKEPLYQAVLEACYRRIRSVEEKVDLGAQATRSRRWPS